MALMILLNSLIRHIGLRVFVVTLWLCILKNADTLNCNIGYGQRGRLQSNGIEWPRDCSDSQYCFEATTSDVTYAKALFDYNWDRYYNTFYVIGCGGEWGTPLAKNKVNVGSSINITAPVIINGQGGTRQYFLRYACSTDFCSPAANTFRGFSTVSFTITLLAVSAFILFDKFS